MLNDNVGGHKEAMEKVDQRIQDLERSSLPPGGTTGQVLAKTSDEDYKARWSDAQGDDIPIAPTYADLAGVAAPLVWVRDGSLRPLSFEPESGIAYAQEHDIDLSDESQILSQLYASPANLSPMTLRVADAPAAAPAIEAELVLRDGNTLWMLFAHPDGLMFAVLHHQDGTQENPGSVYLFEPGTEWRVHELWAGDPVPGDPGFLIFRSVDLLVAITEYDAGLWSGVLVEGEEGPAGLHATVGDTREFVGPAPEKPAPAPTPNVIDTLPESPAEGFAYFLTQAQDAPDGTLQPGWVAWRDGAWVQLISTAA